MSPILTLWLTLYSRSETCACLLSRRPSQTPVDICFLRYICATAKAPAQTYQQIFVYITPIVTNLGFVNVIVVVVRLRWFSQKLKGVGMSSFVLSLRPKLTAQQQRHTLGPGAPDCLSVRSKRLPILPIHESLKQVSLARQSRRRSLCLFPL